MPLSKVPLPIAFAGGLESKQDPKQVPAAKLLNLENATFIKQTTLAKRNGYRALSKLIDTTSAEYGTPVGLAVRAADLLLFDSERCYSYRASIDRWSDTGEVASIVADDIPLARTGTAQSMPDHATNAGITVASWEDSRGGVWLSVLDAASGRVLLRDTLMDADGTRPRCVPCGSVLHVYWVRAAALRIYVAVINPASPGTAPTPAILTDDISASNPAYDACPAGSTNAAFTSLPALIAWAQNGGGWRVGYVHQSGALGSPVTGLPSVATFTDVLDGPIACSLDKVGQALVGVTFTAVGATRIYLLDFDALITGPISLTAETAGACTRVVCEFDASGLWWATEHAGATSNLNTIRCGEVSLAGAVTTAARVLRGHVLVSRAFYDDGRIYAAFAHAVEFFPYVAVVRMSSTLFGGSTGTIAVARLLPGSSTGAPTRGHVASAQPVSPSSAMLSRQHAICLGYRIQLDSENGDQFGEAGIRLTELDFVNASAYQSAELGRNCYLGGAMLTSYDGARWAEADFHTAPDVADGAAAIGTAVLSGGSMADGVYGYKLCYEEVDAQGEVHPGAVSVSFNVTITGGLGAGSVSLAIPTYRLTNKRHVRISAWRSEQGQTGDPEVIPYYRVTSLNPATISGNNRYLLNDPTVDTLTLVDGLTDIALITKEPLYSNGGILSNDPPPFDGACIVGGKSRLFWTDPSDPNLVRYSQQVREDTALEAPIDLAIGVDPYGGEIVGLGVMDGAVFVFKETAIYGFGGPGPLADPDAGQDAFTPAELLTSDVGCKSPASICQSPIGIVFQSEKGIMLLDRSRQVVSIGDPVYAFNDQTITRATLLPDRHQIVFLTSSGYTLLYDYERQQWSKYTNHEGLDAFVVGGTYYYLRTDGRVFVETPGVYADDNSQIVMKIETAWIKMSGYLQGWQKVIEALFLGKYKSAHTLRVRYRVNYEDAYSAPIDLTVNANWDPDLYGEGDYGSGDYGGSDGYASVYQRRIHLNKRCQAMSFRIEDVEATDDRGASFELSELLLIGGMLGPSFRPGNARSS